MRTDRKQLRQNLRDFRVAGGLGRLPNSMFREFFPGTEKCSKQGSLEASCREK